MTSQEEVVVIMEALGYVWNEYLGCWATDTGNYPFKTLTVQQAETMCRDLNKLAEICKKHKRFSMDLRDDSVFVKLEDDKECVVKIILISEQAKTLEEAAFLATAEALKIRE